MKTLNHPRNATVILIPAYKPDHLLIELLKNIKNEGFDALVVNDGSGEEYEDIFSQVKEYAELLVQPKNRGKGAALRYGFSYINLNPNKHQYVITCDADGQHAVKDIIRIDDKMHETGNIVFGCRRFGKNVPRRSKVGNNLSRLSRTLITKDYIQDDQCGLRGFPIKYIPHLLPIEGDHYEYEMNVVCTLQIKKIKIVELPIETIYLNDNKSSHFKPSLDTFRIQKTIWLNALAPFICGLISISLFSLLAYLWPNLNRYIILGICYLFYYELSMGVFALVWPTRKMPRRVLIEGIYATVKTIIVLGLFSLLFSVCHIYSVASYIICLTFTFLLNFPLAYLVWKVKNKNVYRE